MEQTEQKRFPWISVIIVIVLILAGIQYWQTKPKEIAKDTLATNPYATSTDQTTTVPITPVTTTDQVPNTTNNPTKNFMHTITLETNKGTIVFETYDADAPKTAENFVTLAGKGFYNGLIFHRIIEGFMIQGGDPTGTGMGGPGYKFADELNASTESYKTGYVRGTVAMANSGPNTNGSQFFIMHKDTPLPHNYTIFGKVVKGIEIVDAIATSPRDSSDRPLTDIVMKKVTVASK